MLVFHGWSAHAVEVAPYTGLSQRADSAGFIVAYLQGSGATPEWHFAGNPTADAYGAADDVEFVEGLIGRLVHSGCADPERIYLAGHSQGGGMASAMACLLADQVAGAAFVSAEHFRLPCEPSRPVPIVAFHALDDPVLPYAGGRIEGTPSSFPTVLAAEAVAGAWASRDGCASGPEQASLKGDIVRFTWRTCRAPVVLYRMPRGGHGWPGGNYEGRDPDLLATDVIWSFL